jgi:uncharacterized cofD-like protein
MSDSGGSSGRLRTEFGTLPAGDVLRAVIGMSKYDYQMLKQIFYRNRFSETGKLDGHNLGNLFLTLSSQYNGKNFVQSIKAFEQSLEACGHVYPCTIEQTDLVAELENGDIIQSETKIDIPEYDRSIKIKKVFLKSDAEAYREACKVIKEADAIVLGPGDLYTSIIAALLPKGIGEAIGESKAQLVYVAGNAYHVNGETGPTTVSGAVRVMNEYLPRTLNTVIYNNHKLDETQKEYYAERGWGLLEYDEKNISGVEMVVGDFERSTGGLCPEKLGIILKKII